MDPVQKALWFVESHSREPIALEEIARACQVSMYHLTRAFAAAMGWSLMRYVCARRLSEAARRLAQGADDILAVALDAGYGSHEAFTRAFRDQFALTPEQVRAQGRLDNLQLLEPIVMNSQPTVELAPPRFETRKPMLLAGLVERYDCRAQVASPPSGSGLVRSAAFRNRSASRRMAPATTSTRTAISTICAVSRWPTTRICRADAPTLRVPEQKYVIFAHAGHVAAICAHDLGHLEQLVSRVGPQGGRSADAGALWPSVQPSDWHGWIRDLDSDRGVIRCFGQALTSIVSPRKSRELRQRRSIGRVHSLPRAP